ncbi:uncharacterized protein BDR25DRAFT_39795 [Lindgomyces ingoldianus]|uniref:Uncharacterized protein n=1 Tax=Lindgomyces ingoldianus TaxID=673940 RepID=A0ACB6QUQ6_9PLEO|nr:uncharacterized protein BDR25DRAFT_39795 [Lindgomyces ingoldianus]KAF2469805.1 hypothetical protein BDR25DRAFT_39795 [Lindgomyces ingoldianus]
MGIPVLQHDAHEDSEDHHSWGSHNDDVTNQPTPIPTIMPSGGLSFTAIIEFTLSDFKSEMPTYEHQTGNFLSGWLTGIRPPQGAPSTQSSISHTIPYSDINGPQTTPTRIYTGPNPTSTGNNDNGNDGSTDMQRNGPNHTITYAAAGVVPVVILAILGVALFFYLRKRKRDKQVKAVQAHVEEMKTRNQPFVQPLVHPGAPPSTQPQYATPPSHPLPTLASPTTPQPVILGPIAPGSSGAYYTGIDTSDIVSMHDPQDRTGLGNPFVNGDEAQDEPPPPYRPRSVAPLSRDTSLRAPPAAHSHTNLISSQDHPTRSPFADPTDDDDAVSDLSGPTFRRNQDRISVVSDLSYQDDPVVVRPAV